MNTVSEAFVKAYCAALKSLETSGGPDELHPAAAFLGRKSRVEADDQTLRAHLSSAEPNDELRMTVHLALAQWDNAPAEAAWSGGTAPNTVARRARTVALLDVDEATAKLFLDMFPIAGADGDIIIADEGDWQPWYHEDGRDRRDFYWPAYKRLLTDKHWAAESIAALDRSTDNIVARLTDPTRPEAYQSKGLVVGYVQSGKTANFTGVLAKAIDAGYRLIIVLTGTTDLLRSQTQRRLDMELLGVENILGGVDPNDPAASMEVDYHDDPDWIAGKFLKHGVRPDIVDRPLVHRLTTYDGDYKSLRQGIEALNFPKRDRRLPFYDPANLYVSDAKVAIVKKNAGVLAKLAKDLKKISAKLGEIPVLIIDDEADQASVNTTNPKNWTGTDQRDRTAINRLISELMSDLKRAQYIGYTATPFANVFIDPGDAQDLFPKDFIVSLDPPPGYMGVAAFHDLDDESEIEPTLSRRESHVRSVHSDGGDDEASLRRAVDTFVLTGAVKLYRQAHGGGTFRHHTMLVHENMRKAVHKEQADRLRSIWRSAGYSSPTSRPRLQRLFEQDLAKVSAARGEGAPFPPDFDALVPYLSESIQRIESGGSPVLVVNSDRIEDDDEQLDFDRSEHVWRILIGGNKLARGFTIEGLTVSYFLRKTKMADAMMQMGRWFGYRKGYKDLVRLFTTDDLYEAFEAMVRDEEHFRNELRRYAEPVQGEPQITPRAVQPLVAQHLPTLKPTAANKMYNVELVERRSPGVMLEPVAYPKDAALLAKNVAALDGLLKAASVERTLHSSARTRYPALTGIIGHGEFLDMLERLEWQEPGYFAPDLAWLRRMGPGKINDWAVILPQHVDQGSTRRVLEGHGPISLFKRERRRDPFFGAISDPKHRAVAKRVIGEGPSYADPEGETLVRPHRGAVLVYPLIEREAPSSEVIEPNRVVLALVLLAPSDATASDGRLVTFKARDSRPIATKAVDQGD